MSTIAEERGVPFVAPRGMRSEQGNPEITVYCPTCDDRVVVLNSGVCGWCDTDLSADIPETNNRPGRVETSVELQPSPKLGLPEPSERAAIASWRDEEIAAWLCSDGPATAAEIREHFGFPKGSQTSLLDRLRAKALIEKTGAVRCTPGRGGRPSPEFRAVEPGARDSDLGQPPVPDELLGAAGEIVDDDGEEKSIGERIAERRDLGWTIDPTPFGDRPGASERTRAISEEVRREVEARYQVEDEPADAPISVHEQLVVRYLSALIGRVERAGMGGIAEPPDHIYERIEHLLEITEGVR